MRILIVGAGALGGLIGFRLAEHGEDVVLVESNVARAKLLNESGLLVAEGDKGEQKAALRIVTTVAGLEPFDLVFIAVKSYHTEEAILGVVRVIGPRTWVLSTQNGVGNVEALAKHVPPERILSGITFHSIQHTGPNRIRYRPGIKPIQIAPYAGAVTDEIRSIGALFTEAGLPTNVVDNVDHAVWQKLLHNAVVNPVSALADKTCSELLEDEDLQLLMRGLSSEIVAVMQARGVPIQDEEDPYRPVIGSQRALGKNRPSMGQDLMRGFPTEIDAINGGIVEEAERRGLTAPLNWAIVRLIHSRERQGLQRKERGAQTLAEVRASLAARAAPRDAAESPDAPALKPMPLSPQGGMPQGRVPLETAPRLKELIRDYYIDLDAAGRDRRRHVAWCSAFAPVEILRAMGFTPYFPENHAALIGASRLADRYLRLALSEGFSPFVSTEMTSDVGAAIAGESPLASIHGIRGIPHPEVLVYSTNTGQVLARWFEYYSHRFGAPLLGLHPPPWLDEVDEIDVSAAAAQHLRLVERLEKMLGRRLDHDNLARTVDLSARAATLWGRILDLGRHVPSPLTYFDTLIHAAPMLLMRGTESAVTYYEVLLAEIEHRVTEKIAAVPGGERSRFYWEGPPIWCALRPLSALFLNHGIAVVASSYPRAFALSGLDRHDPIQTMARTYTSMLSNRSRAFRVHFLEEEYRKFAVDAAVYHDARTSPEHSHVRYGVHKRLAHATGVRSLVIEADTHDLRLVSLDHIRRQVQEYIEDTRNGQPNVSGVAR